jgi:two-component system OmpR family response regulator
MKTEKGTTVFLVDDDSIFLKVLETQFKERTKYNVKTFSTGEDCLKNLEEKPDIIFLDYYLNPSNPNQTGLKILDKIKIANPKINVIMLSSQDSIEIAVNCMKHQAFDYIVKSEAAFIRAQKAIDLLFTQKRLESQLAKTRIFSMILGGLLLFILIAITMLQVLYPKMMNS